MRRYPADFAPGEQVRSSNSNHTLLGLIIEEHTGQPADVAPTVGVIRPLGLTHAVFSATPDLPEPFVNGYEAAFPGETLRDVTAWNQYVPWTGGAMYSTLADLRVWAEALADAALLSPEMQRPQLTMTAIPAAGTEAQYDLGILSINGLIGHNGGVFGYSMAYRSWRLRLPRAIRSGRSHPRATEPERDGKGVGGGGLTARQRQDS